MNNIKAVEWVLRVAVAGEFIGHGVFALQGKESWISYSTSVGFSAETGTERLTLIVVMDIALAILILVKTIRLVLLWMTVWGFATALIRPIAGEPSWDFVERVANIGAPLALLLLVGWPKTLKEWLR